jgi:hypothetical protein
MEEYSSVTIKTIPLAGHLALPQLTYHRLNYTYQIEQDESRHCRLTGIQTFVIE